MDKGLVLHIGLPKTATTFLQREVFGKNLVHSVSTPMWNQSVAHEVVEFLRGKRSSLSQGVASFLNRDFCFVSHEDMTLGGLGLLWNQSMRLTPGRTIGGLLDLEAHLGRKFDVLVTLRRQDEWLASAYAEAGPAFDRANQRDFERRVAELIEVDAPQRRWLEYGHLIEQLAKSLGPERVHVLLQEDLGSTPELWRETLTDLLPSGAHVPDLTGVQKRNTRRAEGQAWTIRKSDQQIKLSDQVSKAVMNAFSDSNRQLGDFLGRELESLGMIDR